jgi:hypothetical protein
MRYAHGWPVLEPHIAAELLDRTVDPDALRTLAKKISPYPGGGSPAHRLREAANLIDYVREYLAEALDEGGTK